MKSAPPASATRPRPEPVIRRCVCHTPIERVGGTHCARCATWLRFGDALRLLRWASQELRT